MKKILYLPLVAAQILFLIVAWPYLSGEWVFAPKTYIAEREFRMDGLYKEEIQARDTFGASDYLDQERIFLRFYRDSLRNGELPFWNERTFGGISQEDSMIFSYLSPFALPWFFIDNDHVAKGVQIFLLLNFGALAMIWWCRILGVSDEWTLAAIALGTITPLALHFQAHTHQPALYFTGLIILAAFHRLLETGCRKYLMMFFGAVSLAILCNFLSVLLFISIALAIIAMAHFGWRKGERLVVLGRTVLAATLYGLALASLAFFLGPILLESYLVREPTTYTAGSFAPWAGTHSLIDAVSYFHLGNGVWLPLAFALPVFIVFCRRAAGGFRVAEMTGLGLVLYFLFVVLVSSVWPFIILFRSYFPGMEYSANGTFRQVFFANLCMTPVMASLFTHLKEASIKAKVTVLVILLLEFMVGLAVWLLATFPVPSWLAHTSAIEKLGGLLQTRGLVESTGVSALVALAFVVLAVQSVRNRAAWALLAAFSVGIGLAWIYTYQRPNLPLIMDPVAHPIFSGIPKGSRVMTLEDCSSPTRSYYRSQAALAGMNALDGPTEVGLFVKTRRFWDAWNDIPALNQQGANIMEVLWICSEQAIDADGKLSPVFGALLRLIGTEYLFTGRELQDPAAKAVAQVGGLRAYNLIGQWPRISFLPGVEITQFSEVVTSLSQKDGSMLAKFQHFERIREDLHAERVSNIHWRTKVSPAFSGQKGLLFMNSPVEYTNGLEVPFVHLPLEGSWVVEQGELETAFAMTNVPFRMAELRLGLGRMDIRYTLTQYYFWALVSLFGLLGFVFVIRKYGR